MPTREGMAAEAAEFCQVNELPVPTKPSLDEMWAFDTGGTETLAEVLKRVLREETEEACEAIDAGDLPAIARELIDVVYTALVACATYGIPGQQVFSEVHRANLTKLGPDKKPVRDAGGKIIKGPNFQPPDVARVLRAFGWDGELPVVSEA